MPEETAPGAQRGDAPGAQRGDAPAEACARRTVPGWLLTILVGLGVFILILPVLTAPVTSDSQYHYLLSHTRLDGSLLNLPAWVAQDAVWRLAQGRITPVGEFVQHGQYFIGLSTAQWLGVELYVVEAVTRALLILTVVGAFAWCARELYGRGGAATSITTVFAVLFASGATAAETQRNGWTTFVVLCIGTVAIVLGSAAVVLAAQRLWPAARRWSRAAMLAGLFVAGVAVMLFYEMALAAAVFTTAVILTRSWLRRRRDEPLALMPWLVFSAGVGLTLLVTRLLIRRYGCQGPDCYPGFRPLIDAGWPVTGVREVVGALPVSAGTGIVASQGWAGLRVGGWGLLVLAVVGALTLALAGVQARRVGAPVAVDHTNGTVPLVVAAAVTLVVTAAMMSVSVQAQREIITGLASTYRPTPLLWAMCCLLLAPVLVALLHRRRGAVVALVSLALWGAVLGVLSVPASSQAVRVERARAGQVGEDVMRAVVLGPQVYTEPQRCALVRSNAQIAGAVPRLQLMRRAPKQAYVALWGQPMCPAKP